MTNKIIYIRDWEIEVDKLADALAHSEVWKGQHSYKFVKWASEVRRKLNLKVYEP